MYTSALIACIYYFLKRSPIKALIAFGVSFSLKPQAMFLSPLLLTLFLFHRFRFWQFFVVPGVYLVLALPALLVGRPLREILLLYAHQKLLPYPGLTHGATNLYQWVSNDYFNFLFPCGTILAFLLAVSLVIAIRVLNPRDLSDETLMQAAFVCLVLMPYILPTMHERYFFPADVSSLVLAMYSLRRFYYPYLVQICSFFTYLPYLFNTEPVPRPLLALILGVVVVLALKDLIAPSIRSTRIASKESVGGAPRVDVDSPSRQ
jgi:Gpi18-like mannosyltransferase